jgi:bacterioferritin-associated ferredoxin
VCRCEHVTASQILHSLEQGGRDLYGIKLRTRTGMGNCQGRYCMLNAALLLSRYTGSPVETAGLYSVRPPLAPTRLKHIAAQ